MGVTRYLNRAPSVALRALAARPVLLELLTELDGSKRELEACITDPDFDPVEAWGATKADIESFLRSPGVGELECVLEPSVALDKSWAAIQFVLAGTNAEMAVLGGRELAGTGSVVAPKIVEPSEVAAIFEALGGIAPEDFRRRIDLAKLGAAAIYPEIWSDGDAVDYLVDHYETLRDLYMEAAASGDGVLVRTSV